MDGVWFVELAAVADPSLIPRVVASAIGVREQQGRPIVDTLIDSPRSRCSWCSTTANMWSTLARDWPARCSPGAHA
jgi:hypothetical protein